MLDKAVGAPRTNVATPRMYCKLQAILRALKKSEVWSRAEMIGYKKKTSTKPQPKMLLCASAKRWDKKKFLYNFYTPTAKDGIAPHTAYCDYLMQIMPHTKNKVLIICPEMPRNVLFTLRTKLPT